MSEHGEVFRRKTRPHPTLIFAESDIKHPVPRILDTPVTAYRLGKLLGRKALAQDVVACLLALAPVDYPLGSDPTHCGKTTPFVFGVKPAGITYHIVAASLHAAMAAVDSLMTVVVLYTTKI